jgi:phosphoglycolate phosphatase
MYKALFFDLDGTLLDTLTDIRRAINDALKAAGFPFVYSKSDCHSLIGNGADVLIHKALKELDNPTNFAKLKSEYMPRYEAYQGVHTKPFNGMPTILQYLANKGVLLFVCSNKPDKLAHDIIAKNFDTTLFSGIYGQKDNELPKPDPHIINYYLAKFNLEPQDCLMVGDSLPDLLTAKNAKLGLCLCTWGYGFYKPELLNEATLVITKPKELAVLGQ